MLIEAEPATLGTSLRLAPNFRAWQRNTVRSGLLPVIAIGGTRGKSIVVRMLDEIYRAAHLRTATWTNQGIEVRGRRQQGELAAWGTTMQRIAAGTIDVAIQELHWSTVNAVGLPPASYPVIGVTNLWPDDDDDHHEHIRLATIGAERMAKATNDNGLFVAAGEDYRLMDLTHGLDADTMVTARSGELPILQAHLKENGASIWIDRDMIVMGDGADRIELMATREIASSLRGQALFQISNAMTAAGIAYATGIGIDTIRDSLASFSTSTETLPASFNIHSSVPFTAVVNRIETPGITKSIIRAANPKGRRRQMSVFGDLACLSAEECLEIGRMVGRMHGAVLLHSQSDDRLVQAMRRGIASNDYPPLIIHLQTERRALNRMFQTVQPEDVLLIFTCDDGRAANRAIMRQLGVG